MSTPTGEQGRDAGERGGSVTPDLGGWGTAPGRPDAALVLAQPFGPYRGKRIVDLALLAVVGLPALVLGAVCAVAVRLTSAGPVIFRQ